MQYFLHFFTFFLHFSAKIGAFLFIPPNTPHTHLQPQPSQTQPKRPRKSQPKAMRSVFLGRRANRALLPRCVPSFCRSRRAIRCETPCGTPSPVGVPHTDITLQKTLKSEKKLKKMRKVLHMSKKSRTFAPKFNKSRTNL
mgnify:CR=1 FL=1